MSIAIITEVSRILSDANRVRILWDLKKNGGMCVYEIAEEVGASQSATSHQLSKMEAKEIVVCFRDGQKMCYELTQEKKTKQILKTLSYLY